MIVWGSPMADPNVHNHRRCPLVLMGHADGQLKGGLHLKTPDGLPMANVMLTVLHKLGMDDVKSFGDSTGEFNVTDVIGFEAKTVPGGAFFAAPRAKKKKPEVLPGFCIGDRS